MLIFDSYAIIFQPHVQSKVLMQSTSLTPPGLTYMNASNAPNNHFIYGVRKLTDKVTRQEISVY